MPEPGPLGRNIARIRKERGLKQSELFEASNVSQATISRLESGHIQNTRTVSLKAIAEALDVSPGELLNPVSPEFRPGFGDGQRGERGVSAAERFRPDLNCLRVAWDALPYPAAMIDGTGTVVVANSAWLAVGGLLQSEVWKPGDNWIAWLEATDPVSYLHGRALAGSVRRVIAGLKTDVSLSEMLTEELKDLPSACAEIFSRIRICRADTGDGPGALVVLVGAEPAT